MPFFEMDPHEIFPDSWAGLWADGKLPLAQEAAEKEYVFQFDLCQWSFPHETIPIQLLFPF